MEKEQRIFGLDLFRVIAITLVIFSQCLWMMPNLNPLINQLTSVLFFFALETFFVLNGYLLFQKINPLLMAGDFRWHTVKPFLKRKLWQILPLYFLFLLLNLLFALLQNQSIEEIWKYFFLLQNFNAPISKFFAASWGLPIIIWADLLLPIVLLLLFQIFKPTHRRSFFVLINVLLISIGIVLKVGYHFSNKTTDVIQWDAAMRSVVIYRLDAVFLGVLAGWFIGHFEGFFRKMRYVLAMMGFAGLLFFTVGVGFLQLLIESHPLFWNVLYLPLASLTIACFLPVFREWKRASSGLQNGIRRLSRMSYAVYLLGAGIMLNVVQMSLTAIRLPILLVQLSYVVLTFLLAALLYRFCQSKRSGTDPFKY